MRDARSRTSRLQVVLDVVHVRAKRLDMQLVTAHLGRMAYENAQNGAAFAVRAPTKPVDGRERSGVFPLGSVEYAALSIRELDIGCLRIYAQEELGEAVASDGEFFGPMVVARVYGWSAEGVGGWVGLMRCLADGSIIIIGRSGLGRTGDGIIVIIVIIVIIDGGERRRERGMLSRSRSGARRLRGR